MNNHKKDDLLNHKIGKKCDKENTNLGNLLKVMLIHLSFFLNLKSIFNLSSTNKKLRKLFYEFRKIFGFFNQNRFIKNLDSNRKNLPVKKEKIKNLLISNKYDKILDKNLSTPLNYACLYDSPPFDMIKIFVGKLMLIQKIFTILLLYTTLVLTTV